MKKKILLSFILICISIFAFGMLTVSAETTGTYGDLTYKIENGEITITDCDESATEIEIPEEIDGKSVTEIGNYAFYNCTALTKINWNAKKVSDFTSSIDVFCNAGTKGDGIDVVFGDSVEHIPAYLFYVSNSSYQPKIKSVTIGNSVTKIGDYVFYNCSGLTSITIGDSVTEIGKGAFDNCGYVNDETNWDGEYLYLGNYLIEAKSTVVAAKVKDGTTVMIDHIFDNCIDLLKVTLPESLINIPNYAFSGCTDLFSISLPSKINTIGEFAFGSCYKLTKINIPDTVEKICDFAFWCCSSLEGVYITDVAAWCNIDFYTPDSNPLRNATKLYINDVLVENITVPQSVTKLNDYVFCYCDNLKSITLPDNLTSIGKYAFSDCDNLQSINIPASVTNIGTGAFDTDAHYWGTGTRDVYISDLSAWCKLNFEVLESNPLRYGANLYLNNTLVKELSIPNDITTINANQFYNCRSITAVKIHSNVEKIEENAFYGCENIEYVEIPKDLFYIKNDAFYGCNSLAEVHYGGTESDWEEIIIAGGNDSLKNARVQSIYYITLIDEDDNTSSITCQPNTKIKISDIEKKYMHKVTLYTDKAMTKEFDATTAITDNMTLYVKHGEWIPDITASVSTNGTLSITGSLPYNISDAGCTMLGVYKNAMLLKSVDISKPVQNKLNLKLENMQGADMVKLFRWNSLSNMAPLYGAVEVEVK